MKEHPILFTGDMVRAILDGRKTQTRRVIRPQPDAIAPFQDGEPTEAYYNGWPKAGEARELKCPYGIPGDRLWVRETWRKAGECTINDPCYGYRATMKYACGQPVPNEKATKWKPSIHMPRAASRITLEVTDVRVERVQDISEVDAQVEGCVNDVKLEYGHMTGPIDYKGFYAVERFETLWDSINAKRGYGWDKNPWVWVVTFKRI